MTDYLGILRTEARFHQPESNHVQTSQHYPIDVVGEYTISNRQQGNARLGAWLVSVRYRERKLALSEAEGMGEKDVEAFIQQAAALQAEKQYATVTRWFFSKTGFTVAAAKQLKAAGIYFSDLQQCNALSALFGLLPLQMG